MNGFSSQWLANIIELHIIPVLFKISSEGACVCSCDEGKDRENMKRHDVYTVCVFVLLSG